MIETCDKSGCCNIRAAAVFTKDDMLLTFCGHHANEIEKIAEVQGFKRIELVDNKN